MNQELEKLVDYAITDGYITDKEKKVLLKKAEQQGFDIDELELILEGRLYEAQQKQNKNKPTVSKCPSCGEIMSGMNRVCPSCNYIIHSESKNITTLDEYMQELEKNLVKLKMAPKASVGKILKSVILIYLSVGIYILYKKLIKKQNLFAPDNDDSAKINAEMETQLRLMSNNYGEDSKVSSYISKITAERNVIIKQRKTTGIASVVMAFIIFGGLFYLMSLIPAPEKSESAKLDDLIKEGKYQTAKGRVEAVVKDEGDRKAFFSIIAEHEVDSLYKAGLYDEALQKANLLSYPEVRKTKISEIVAIQVNGLIQKGDYKQAREKAELDEDYFTQQGLIRKIETAEKLNKK